jgi:dienelactone hydrolase
MHGYAGWPILTNLCKVAALVTALLSGSAVASVAAEPQSPAAIVELESPLATPLPLQGYLRQPHGAGPWPAVVLLHSCNGHWKRLDQRWGKRVASWGYVTLTVDSFGPRGLKNTCGGGAATVDLAFDAYRALNYLVQQPFVDPARVAALGFSQGGWLALTSVEPGAIERASANKFRAAIAFYPPCLGFKDNMTVPILILIGEADDWTLAQECRNMVEGRDDWGISRHKGGGAPIKLVVYPNAYHAFDASSLQTPVQYFGHHLEFNPLATEQSIDAVREFLDATIGEKTQAK